jgi:hypothetical protein
VQPFTSPCHRVLPSLAVLQVGDTVHLIVQDVDTVRRRLSLALDKLEDDRQAEAAVQSTVTLATAAGEKRPMGPLCAAGSSGSGAKHRKQ